MARSDSMISFTTNRQNLNESGMTRTTYMNKKGSSSSESIKEED
jgi:hypothetical protein